MKQGIVLKSEFGSSPCINSSVSGMVSPLSTPSLEMKKKKHLHRNILLSLFFVISLVILVLIVIIVTRLFSHYVIPITSSSSHTNQSVEINEFLSLVDSISLEHMFIHLRQLRSRAIGTISFNRTVDYLISQISKEDSFIVQKYYFSVPRFELDNNLILMALPNKSNASIFTYPRDFVPMRRTTEARNWSLIDGRPLSVVARLGCYLEDWNETREGDVALVRRGNCTFVQKILLAMNKGVSAFLIYNDGLTIARLQPLNNTRAPKNNTLPTLFLSYEAGMRLILENISRIYLRLEFRSLPPIIVTNVCADTKFGHTDRTIVVGSHSDSVSTGCVFKE